VFDFQQKLLHLSLKVPERGTIADIIVGLTPLDEVEEAERIENGMVST
jgi:hypothetical protein